GTETAAVFLSADADASEVAAPQRATTPSTAPGAPATASVSPAGGCLDPAAPPERSGSDADNQLYNGTNPKRTLTPYSPFRLLQVNCAFPADYRVILVEPSRAVLQAGGQVLREVPLPRGALDFGELAQALSDPNWILRIKPGTYEVKAAIVQAPGTSLRVAAPDVSDLRLVDNPHVFLGGRGAEASFEGVTVTSWARDGSGPDENYADGRPFVLYSEGSQFDIDKSTFTFLGSDRSSAYGISWRVNTSGTITDSSFTRNFFGQFSYEADGLVYRGNRFESNVFYGVDPHDRSRNMLFEDNFFVDNGSHGAIVSREVHDSIFRSNTASGNGGNGMVIDAASFAVTFDSNTVSDNAADGIVILRSRDNKVLNNTVTGNRVGIRVNGEDASGNLLSGNTIEDNEKGVEAYGGASDLRVEGGSISRNSVAGLTLDAEGSSLTNVAISGSPVGLELRAPATAEGTTIDDVAVGVAVKSPDRVTLTGLDIKATEIGVRVDRESAATLTRASIEAPTPYKGSEAIEQGDDLQIKTLAPPGLHWFGVVGAAFLAAAILLELVRRFRMRRYPNQGEAPQIVASPV
ncbi:MAG: right-handed parallel beta-helix repeat-containing protein, partial [Acidimicrobiia bacterium]|nr:right-handed parallel beta-helix repeat-containing protein [Acidimicrobiia bacterium]